MPVIAMVILGASLFFANSLMKRFGNKAPAILFLIVSLVCEIFCFNFESFRSFTYPEIENYTIEYSSGVTEDNGSYEFRSSSDYISITGFDKEVENIYIKTNTTQHTVRFFVSDEANVNRYHAGDRIISRYSKQTSYIKTNFTGKASEIKIYIPDISNRIVTLSDISLNCQRPIFFSLFRPLGCFAILMFVYYIIAKKHLWQKSYDPNDKEQSNFTMFIACALALIFLAIPYLNPGFINPSWAHHNQYNELAQAFLNGQLHLDKEVPDILLEMENPYDRYERQRVFREAKIAEPWDTAFYNGKFYVYFGVLPVFLFYLPAQLLGINFPNFLAIVIFSWVLIAGVFLLYGKIIKMYMKDIPYLLYLVLSTATVLTGGVLYIIKRPDFYSIPIIGALAFTIMGFYFWISALDGKQLSRQRLFIGSVFMACVLALRPNLVFFSCTAFMLFWGSVFRDRELLSINSRLSDEKYRGLKNTLAFCMPYIVIGVLIMVYNAARFSSPFDFGASYNLTTSDMTKRGFALDRWGLGVFEYLFRPPTVSASFPFLTSSYPSTSYIGFTSREGMFGGIFATYPILWSLFAMHKTRDKSPLSLHLCFLQQALSPVL
ncbi:MAG: hypothetical protein IJ297_00615 [Clostridia bacterium]|nr:hypothetical protein [Clostridia bacterium]